MSNALVTCNGCGKPISMPGVKTAKLMAGDYTVEYFLCPHCGRKYAFRTTDTEQRQLVKKHAAIIQKRKLGIAKKFKLKTLNKYYKEQKKIYKKIEERAQTLMQIGRALVAGDELEDILKRMEENNNEKKPCGSYPEGDHEDRWIHTERRRDHPARTIDQNGETIACSDCETSEGN